jgi:hypothetical protein
VPDLLEYVAHQLGLRGPEMAREITIRRGLRVDGELRVPGHRYVVEAKWGVARWEHLSQLSLVLQLLGKEQPQGERLTGVLVASAIPPDVEEAARAAGVMTLKAPVEVLGEVASDRPPVLLTKPKSWAVVIGLLRRDSWPDIRVLADATSASKSWTQVVVSDLAARGIVEQRRGHIALADLKRLMDRVASERPLRGLMKIEFATGFGSWEELLQFLAQQWSPTLAKMERPGLWACGPTAAMAYTNYLARHDRFHAYTDSPGAVQALFKTRKGGIPVVLYTPDRPMGPDATTWQDIHVTGLHQTLLDMMGSGYSARDTTRALLEVLRA